jgi:hypothetical protein
LPDARLTGKKVLNGVTIELQAGKTSTTSSKQSLRSGADADRGQAEPGSHCATVADGAASGTAGAGWNPPQFATSTSS